MSFPSKLQGENLTFSILSYQLIRQFEKNYEFIHGCRRKDEK